MSFSPFPIPTRSEHERDLAGGKSQIPYEDLVALMEEIAVAEEELLSAAAGGYPYVLPMEEGHAEHPPSEGIKSATLRHLYLAMNAPVPDWSPMKGRRGQVRERYPVEQWRAQLKQWQQATEAIYQRTSLHEQFLAQADVSEASSA
jgi:hypothetical protein